jgi:hypothetical protein
MEDVLRTDHIDPVDDVADRADDAAACDRRSCHGEQPLENENENPSAKRNISVEGTDAKAIVEPPRRPPTLSKSTEKTPKACDDCDKSDDCWIHQGKRLGYENQQ